MKTYTFDFYNSANLRSYNLTDTMRFQLSILDRMDSITKKHSENVANLVCRICEYLHFNTHIIIHYTMSAYLHDVGKLMIPKEILNKPDKLTEEEFEIMKTHTTKGYEICMKNPELRPYAQAALFHHEALNGTGYPNGLTKKDIPYVAQIVRVADEYDAIVTKRQYKTHINISETLKELIKDTKIKFAQKDRENFLKTITLAYKKAPFYDKFFPVFKDIVENVDDDLTNYIKYSFEQVKNYLGLDTEILISSQIEKDNTLHAQDRIIEINKRLGATQYINAIGGQELYNKSDFDNAGIKLNFIKMLPVEYKQFKGDFVSNLSFIDVLMFNDTETIKEYLSKYELL